MVMEEVVCPCTETNHSITVIKTGKPLGLVGDMDILMFPAKKNIKCYFFRISIPCATFRRICLCMAYLPPLTIQKY